MDIEIRRSAREILKEERSLPRMELVERVAEQLNLKEREVDDEMHLAIEEQEFLIDDRDRVTIAKG